MPGQTGEKHEYPDHQRTASHWADRIQARRKRNVGLHHLALKPESEDALNTLHERLANNGTKIEFSPELLREGPAKHMMCYEPSGIRVEFIWPGN